MGKVAKKLALLVAVSAACSQMALAQIPPPQFPPNIELPPITNENSSLKWTLDPPDFFFSPPSDPVQLPRELIWTVDGRPILVYPSAPWNVIDVSHFHTNGHVGADQLHAQGPLLGYATNASDGTITGGAVYTIDGRAAGSGESRMVEKVEIHNKGTTDATFTISGAGFSPVPHGGSGPQPTIPDYSGLEVTGTTTVFYQGNANKYFLSDILPAGFPPSVVFPIVSFTGFNPTVINNFELPAGALLTIITELKVKPADATTPPVDTPDKKPRHMMRDWKRSMDKDEHRREHSDHHK